MNKWRIILGILFAILSGGLFGGSSASAASAYDTTISNVSELDLVSSNGNHTLNVSEDWLSYFSSQSCYSDIEGALQFGSISLSLGYENGTDLVFLNGLYSSSLGAPALFDGTSPNSTLKGTNISGAFRIFIEDNGNIYRDCNGYGTAEIIASETSVGGFKYRPFISSFIVDYPVDYEGETIPQSYTPPVPPLDWIPDFYALQGIDYKVTIQDKSFNTFDEVPFTCNDGLTPVIKYEIRDSSNEIVVIGQFSATIQLEQQLPKNNIESTYTIIGNYDCGYSIDPTQPDFSGQASKQFTITAGGLLVNEVFTSCFIETAPFIDFENCINNMAETVGMLSFGSIKFSNNWQFDSNCRELAVLGGWLNLEGSDKVICPQFPEYIRNVVTPFVTLILGFITLKFITSRGGSGI